ncbi:MAG: isoprenylcysteine carboxylmethyltransferase family protein [Saprospiraceae bacterium]
MQGELYFIILLVSYYLLHSLFADVSVKNWLQKRFIPNRWYRIFFNLVAILGLLPLLYCWIVTPKQHLWQVTVYQEFIAGLFILTGSVLLYLAMRNYNLSEFSGVQQFNDSRIENNLRTDGLNQYVRHPLYFATPLLLLGFFLYYPHHFSLILVLISTLYIYIGTRLEERKLVRTFGATYQTYQRTTPMLIPWII